MRVHVLLLALLIPLSGCVGSDDPVETEDQPDPVPEAPPIREFYWATQEKLGDVAIRFDMDLPPGNGCDLEVAAANDATRSGADAVMVYETEAGTEWTMFASGQVVNAHAGPVDTVEVLGAPGAGGMMASRGGIGGPMTVTIIAQGLQPQDLGLSPGNSLAIDIECSGLIGNITATRGPGVVAGATGLEAGVAAELGFYASAAVQGGLTLAAESDRAGFLMGAFGTQVGEVTVEHPDGVETYSLPSDDTGEKLEAGAGRYDVTVDYAGAYVQAFWVALYDLADDLDLALGMRADEGVGARN